MFTCPLIDFVLVTPLNESLVNVTSEVDVYRTPSASGLHVVLKVTLFADVVGRGEVGPGQPRWREPCTSASGRALGGADTSWVLLLSVGSPSVLSLTNARIGEEIPQARGANLCVDSRKALLHSVDGRASAR